MKTGLVTSDTYQYHNTGEGHPEKIDRVTVVIDNFIKLDNKNLIWKKPTNFDQDLLIKKGGVIVYVGDNVTADNNISPTYLSADTQLRSADFENEISLTHNATNKESTMIFTNAPTNGTIITVDRVMDKYLVFRNKGI